MRLAYAIPSTVLLLSLAGSAIGGPADHTLRIVTRGQDGNDVLLGSGVFVQDDGRSFVVTAYHVVRNQPNLRFAFGTGPLDSENPFEKGWVEPSFVVRTEYELCVFRCTDAGRTALMADPFRRVPVPLAASLPPVGTRIVAIGNPVVRLFRGLEDVAGGRVEHAFRPLNLAASATLAESTSAGKLLGKDAVNMVAHDTPLIHLDGVGIAHGFSGGPLMASASQFHQDDATLVGVLIGGDPKNGITTWGVAIPAIREALLGGPTLSLPVQQWPSLKFVDRLYSLPASVDVEFPVVFPGDGFFEQRNVVKGQPWHMKTRVIISENGRVDGETETLTDEFLKGFIGKAVIFLCDVDGNVLARVDSPEFGIPVGIEKKRRDPWHREVDPAILTRVRKVKIEHFHAPNDEKFREAVGAILDVVKQGDGGEEIRSILKNLDGSFELRAKP